MTSGSRENRPAAKPAPEAQRNGSLTLRSPGLGEAMEVLREHRAASPAGSSFTPRESRPAYTPQVKTFLVPEKPAQPARSSEPEPVRMPSKPDKPAEPVRPAMTQ